jgi:hypothetical protein
MNWIKRPLLLGRFFLSLIITFYIGEKFMSDLKTINYLDLDCENCFTINESIHGHYENDKSGNIPAGEFKQCKECFLYGAELKVSKILKCHAMEVI